MDYLRQAHRTTGSSLALSMGLHLAGRLLGEQACAAVLGPLALPRPPVLCRMLLTPGVVLRSHATLDSPRRQWFRALLKRKRN
jgi:hypothetical protein